MERNITITSTIGGTLLSLTATLRVEALLETAVMAAVGASCSFIVTLLLRWLLRKLSQRTAKGRNVRQKP